MNAWTQVSKKGTKMLMIKNEQALFFQYLNFLPTPILIGKEDKSNKRAKVLFVNQSFIKTIGYEAIDIPDHLSFISKAYPDTDYRHNVIDAWQNGIVKLVKGDISLIKFCTKIFCKDHQYRWFEVRTELKSTIGKGVILVLFNNVDKAKNEALEYAKLSRIDPLTKLANRRYMHQLLQQEKSQYDCGNASEESFSLIMADIDFFKKINDSYGHNCGDYVIATVANIMQKNTRRIDTVARWGGEEYLLLLSKTTVSEARIVAKKIITQLHQYVFEWEGQALNVSLTYGVTEYHFSEKIHETIKRADSHLYLGKRQGRNCIVGDSLLEGSVL
jgi:diguanylate cyclase (GGDEF)-like protein